MTSANKRPSEIDVGRKPLHIIAGAWRGRRIPILALNEVRPTTSRIRETLFNWLQPFITGAHCLDAFAGTGILGLEALSRGAASVMFVDKQAVLCKQLQAFLKMVDCHQAKVLCQSFPDEKLMAHIKQPLDLIFLDPPYQQDLWVPVLQWLTKHQLVHAQSLVFFEHPRTTPVTWPEGWQYWREQTAGNVHFGLLKYDNAK